ncbi:hypothetical protein E2P71_05005 [Candidatus Bathyarchaeota archaeon]|nr:hypothetical protein E2P71_05005 [Candidatus Bathyarchaeota archaeon]
MEEINELLYYFSDKYGYDPLDYKINLMTGIVVPKKREGAVNARAGEPPIIVKPPSSAERQFTSEEDEKAPPPSKRVEIEDSVEGLRTYKIYAYSQQETAAGITPIDTGDHLRELDDWITCNGLSYLEARRLIASLELNKRMGELYPHLDRGGGEGALSDFDEWIRCKQLSYFKVRMMIAELGQEEERSRLEAVAA